jgi:hypothetical protein
MVLFFIVWFSTKNAGEPDKYSDRDPASGPGTVITIKNWSHLSAF